MRILGEILKGEGVKIVIAMKGSTGSEYVDIRTYRYANGAWVAGGGVALEIHQAASMIAMLQQASTCLSGGRGI